LVKNPNLVSETLVIWTDNRITRSGVIEKMYNKLMGGREVVFAAVFEFSERLKNTMFYV
jgi:hypothetical protein